MILDNDAGDDSDHGLIKIQTFGSHRQSKVHKQYETNTYTPLLLSRALSPSPPQTHNMCALAFNSNESHEKWR
eukprot:m.156777 g.156777  ORF g.156777 m.156777 type:complete len:73 (-) comp31024_c0_seq3:54-272(-)